MKYDSVNAAAHAWVQEFNQIPTPVVQKLLRYDPDEIMEITPISIGDRVTVFSETHWGVGGEVVRRIDQNGITTFQVELDNDECIYTVSESEVEPDYGYIDTLPMWGAMWSFGDSLDNEWLDQEENRVLMASCGFRIYEQEDYRYIFGIDGAGYDFYEAHWIPLYLARGLRWHRETYNTTEGYN